MTTAPTVNKRLSNLSLARQLALVTAILCLVVSLGLVALGAISSRHMQMQLLEEQGDTLATQLAARVSNAMESGDLLSASASLQRFIDTSGEHRGAREVTLKDVDDKVLGHAGRADGANLLHYSAPVHIENDIAGRVTLTLSADEALAAQSRFVLTLLGLAVMLSLVVFGVSHQLGQRLAARLAAMGRTVSLQGDDSGAAVNNELQRLEQQVQALPMDLLRTRGEPSPREENYRDTAVLYLHLASLQGYVDTLDQQSLHRYTDRIHQVVYTAAGFYGGELQVTRQFGLAVFFTGQNSAGSAAFRAASCAWLVCAAAAALEKKMSLSMHMAAAVSQSELGFGDSDDIYPGLYIQHTLDELQAICSAGAGAILLSPGVMEDVDIGARLRPGAPGQEGYAPIEEFAETYRDLLERQLHLIMKRLAAARR